MPNILWIVFYIFAACIVVFLSIKLSDFVDLLDKKTNVSGAFLGGILLAAITSLPELFTSISATLISNNNQLVVGNILGSDLFNLSLFAIIYLGFFGKMIASKVNKAHIISMFFTGVLYIVIVCASYIFNFNNILWGWFNPLSIGIVAIYSLSVMITPKSEEAESKETNSKLTVKQIIILFIIFSVLLIGSSIGMTLLVDKIVQVYKIGATFGGALFLGVATSLPELTATVNLCRKKNFNAAIGDIVGSNVFNCIILAIADLLSFNCKTHVYNSNQSMFILLICGFVSLLAVTISLIVNYKGIVKNNIKWRIFYIFICLIVIGSYFSFLLLSNINLNIPFAPMN